MKLEFFPLQKF